MKDYFQHIIAGAILFILGLGLAFLPEKQNHREISPQQICQELSPGETLARMAAGPAEMTKAEALQLLENPGPYVKLIDIRAADKYQRGHAAGAINIPVPNLTKPENLALLKNTAHTPVLYGQNKAQAYGPWLLFQQMGMDHIR